MKSNKENQSAYKERMRADGYVQVTIWIKKNKKEELKNYAHQQNMGNAK